MTVDPPNLQELHYNEEIDYRHGSPHLTHHQLRDVLVTVLRDTYRHAVEGGRPPTALEIGAGHGGFTEPLLAAGAHVTAVEMSAPSVQVLERSFGSNPNFHSMYEPTGAISAVERFSLVACVSVLHHVPDYLGFINELADHVLPGGSFISLQDPLWYPRRAKTHLVDRSAFLVWRLGQGDILRGLRTQGRRVRGVVDTNNPSDMVEYHVVRNGLDEESITAALRERFERVQVLTYWSHQWAQAQRVGKRLGLLNTFGVIAEGRRG